jgi:hypothetical protein
MAAYIIREHDGRFATLVELVDNSHLVDGQKFERRTEYTEYRGLLCRRWNLDNGQGDQFEEVCGGLRSHGATIPVKPGADIAEIIQAEYAGPHRYRPAIRASADAA